MAPSPAHEAVLRGHCGHARSYRVTVDRAGRWHVAFTVIPEPIPAPGNGQTAGIDRGVAVSAALSTGELLRVPGLTVRERTRTRRRKRKLARTRRGSNRRARVKLATARLRARETDRRKDWAEKASTDIARRFDLIRVDANSRESQARFACTACGYTRNADVNAARNIAAGHAVTARGGFRDAGPVNREPHLLVSLTGCG